MSVAGPWPGAAGARRGPIVAAVVLTTLIAVLVVVAVRAGDRGDHAGPTTTTAASRPGPATGSTTPTAPAPSTAIWPPAGGATYASPGAAAQSFATTFLGFVDPVVEPFEAGDSRSGEVVVRPTARGPATTVLVRQLGPEEDWSVLGSTTDGIEVTDPPAGADLASPVTVRGRALAFEGHVAVEVRADGRQGPIGSGFVTGGGDVLRPFSGSIPFATPSSPSGALVFLTRSAEDGRVWSATAFRVGFRPVAAAGEMAVRAYFTDDGHDGELRAVTRSVAKTPRVLGASLQALLAGPTAEERAAGLGSWFSQQTAGALRSASISDGHAVVDLTDLRPLLPGASSSAGSARLLSQLDATVFQFPSVRSVEYRLVGSCEAFTEWLQLGGCEPRTRPATGG